MYVNPMVNLALDIEHQRLDSVGKLMSWRASGEERTR